MTDFYSSEHLLGSNLNLFGKSLRQIYSGVLHFNSGLNEIFKNFYEKDASLKRWLDRLKEKVGNLRIQMSA